MALCTSAGSMATDTDEQLFEQVALMVSDLYYEGVDADELRMMISNAAAEIKEKKCHFQKGPCLLYASFTTQH